MYNICIFGFHEACLKFLFAFNQTPIFATDFKKRPQIQTFSTIRAAEAALFHSEGREQV